MFADDNFHVTLRELGEISSKYIAWYSKVIRSLIYRDEIPTPQKPKSYISWLHDEKERKQFDAELVQESEEAHQQLIDLAYALLDKAQPIDESDFTSLSKLFEIFFDKIQLLQRKLLVKGSGLDELTGLKSKTVMYKDLAREMDRLARYGKPFSLAILRVKNNSTLDDKIIKKVSKLIGKSIRSFDDAYYISNGEFILCLKQADISGGLRALERLEELLYENNKRHDAKIQISCFVSEPSQYQDLGELISNLEKDLNAHEKNYEKRKKGRDIGAVREYQDKSPLERFINTISAEDA